MGRRAKFTFHSDDMPFRMWKNYRTHKFSSVGHVRGLCPPALKLTQLAPDCEEPWQREIIRAYHASSGISHSPSGPGRSDNYQEQAVYRDGRLIACLPLVRPLKRHYHVCLTAHLLWADQLWPTDPAVSTCHPDYHEYLKMKNIWALLFWRKLGCTISSCRYFLFVC